MARQIQYYEVVSIEGSHGLQISNMVNESFELTVEAIDEAVARAKEQGYNNDEKWLIVEVIREREWNDDGMFLWDKVTRKAIAFYDNGTVTKLEEA